MLQINMKMRYLAVIVVVIVIASCSAPRKAVEKTPLLQKKDMNNLSIDGTISTTFPELNQSLNFSLKAAGKDSIKVEIFGPLSLVVGRLFSTNDKFLFYNTITSEAYQGTPSAKNLKYALNLPLSYSDFVSFIRCEPAHLTETYAQDLSYISDNKFLYKSEQKGYIDYILTDANTNLIIQQQRKMMDGRVILNVLYDDYQETGNQRMPYSMTFNFPLQDGSIFIKADNIEINEKYSKPFSFNLPASIRINNFD